MLPHWDTVIRPFLAALDRGPVIEIGSARGDTTAKLAELAVERDFTLHSVDPQPRFDVSGYERRYGGHFCFHQERSHDLLERIEPPAGVLIDGDHNWYTVHGELTRLERLAVSGSRHFPLVMLHDMEWPYARRDMYYDPEAIPQEWRKPWARSGIKWEESELSDTGGINSSLANATVEGGPRNGVLTAVEDFIEECEAPLELRIVRGSHGIGVLLSRDLLDSSPPLRRNWERLCSTEFLLAEAERLSGEATEHGSARLAGALEAKRLKRETEAAGREQP